VITTLTPGSYSFFKHLWIAYQWTQQRKPFYFRTGGYQDFPDYFRIAQADNRKQFALEDGERFVSLITVEMFAKDAYEFHVTSRRNVDAGLIRAALVALAESFFEQMNAQILVTTVPRYAGHWHTGSKALAEYLGCAPNGEPERAEWVNGKMIEYQLYVLSKESWLNGRRS
jgi:RimJ/RimL family protein N-acetyltransferase